MYRGLETARDLVDQRIAKFDNELGQIASIMRMELQSLKADIESAIADQDKTATPARRNILRRLVKDGERIVYKSGARRHKTIWVTYDAGYVGEESFNWLLRSGYIEVDAYADESKYDAGSVVYCVSDAGRDYYNQLTSN